MFATLSQPCRVLIMLIVMLSLAHVSRAGPMLHGQFDMQPQAVCHGEHAHPQMMQQGDHQQMAAKPSHEHHPKSSHSLVDCLQCGMGQCAQLSCFNLSPKLPIIAQPSASYLATLHYGHYQFSALAHLTKPLLPPPRV
jgi:hypothetical protein